MLILIYILAKRIELPRTVASKANRGVGAGAEVVDKRSSIGISVGVSVSVGV